MPIVVTVPQAPNPWFGPGATYTVSSDFIGPIPADSQWNLNIRLPGSEEIAWTEIIFGEAHNAGATFLAHDQPKSSVRGINQPTQGQEIRIDAELQTPTGIIDTGSTTATWDATRGLGVQSFLSLQGTSSSGFTASDRALLTAAERRSQTVGEPTDLVVRSASGPTVVTLANLFSRQTLDSLTLTELTTGPSGDPLRVSIDMWYWGIIVRVTTIPEDLLPKTPDEQWFFPDLAVLRIFRGVDLQYRRGIHTPTFMKENPWEWGWQVLNMVPVLDVPPETTIAVDWRLGCEGQVFLQRFP